MMENKERNWVAGESSEIQSGGTEMKHIKAIVLLPRRTGSNAASNVSRLVDSIGAGFMRLMAAGIVGTLAILSLAAPATADVPRGFTFVRCSGAHTDTGPVNRSQLCTGVYGESANADLSGTSAGAAGTVFDGTYPDDETGPDLRGGSSASTSYFFDVLASGNFDPSVLVPVRIDAFLTTGTVGTEGDFLDHSYAEADLGVSTGFIADLGFMSCSGFTFQGSCDGLATVDASAVVDLFPFSRNEVQLRASITLDSLFQSSASAFADPYIRIDPAFLAHHPGYSLAFSSNITNGPPVCASVPQPPTVWLLGGGLLALLY